MTMHLLGPQFSTISTRKRKKKLTDTQYHKMCMDWSAYNKQMKKMGCKTKTLEEYIAYRQGKLKPQLKGVIKDPLKATTFRRTSPNIPSYGDQVGSIPAKPEQKYTGTLIKGVATMHKSNAVPVINEEQMHEVARMRRG